MSSTIAPKGGYDFEAKELYRYKVWDCFASEIREGLTRVRNAKVGFMPSEEGLEIPIALSFGFKEENLFAIDRDRKMMEKASWHKQYPLITLLPYEVKNAGDMMIHENHPNLKAVNLDLCGNISVPTIDAITGFLNSGCMDSLSTVAITLMNGRENSLETLMLLKLFSKNKSSVDRVDIVSKMCMTDNGNKCNKLTGGNYISTEGTKMSWGVMSFLSKTVSKTVNNRIVVPSSKPSKHNPAIAEPDRKSSMYKVITFRGKKMTVREALKITGVGEGTYRGRVLSGRDMFDAITIPTGNTSTRGNDPRTSINTIVMLRGVPTKVRDILAKSGLSAWTYRNRMQKGMSAFEAATKPLSSPKRGKVLKAQKYTFDGKTLTLAEWGKLAGFASNSLKKRLAKGHSIGRAVTEPNVISKQCYKPVTNQGKLQCQNQQSS